MLAVGGSIRMIRVAWVLVMLSGCGSAPERPAPPTYPVTGEVLAFGGQPAAGAKVMFRPVDGGLEVSATGLTDSEGKFSLSVLYPDRKIPGAKEGAHRVFIYKPLDFDRGGGDQIAVEEEFVVEPKDNHFQIILPDKSW